MKKWIPVIVIALLCTAIVAAVQVEDKFTIPVFQWLGLDSDEPFALTLTQARDSWNLEFGNEGDKTFIRQRRGSERILPVTPTAIINSMMVVQIDGDSERVVIDANGTVYETTNSGEGWKAISNGGGGAYSTFVLFKDTLLFGGADSLIRFALNGSGVLAYDTSFVWPYRRILLHQDRIYGYGVDDSTNTKLVWLPEFSIDFNSDSVAAQVALGTSGSVYIDRDAGDFITNVETIGEHLACYKSRTIYKILISPTANVPVEIIRAIENIGAYGYGSVCRWNNMHFFVASDGVYSYDGNSVSKISSSIDFWFQDSLFLTSAQTMRYQSQIFDHNLFVNLPLGGGSTHNSYGSRDTAADYRTFVYDFRTHIWSKWKIGDAAAKIKYGTDDPHLMIRYEYSPTCVHGLSLTNTKYKQRLLFERDSSTTNDLNVTWMYPSDVYLSDGGNVFTSYYETGLSPLTQMWKRKQFERVMIYGEAIIANADSAKANYIVFSNENGDIDSIGFTITSSPFMFNYRVPTGVEGTLLGYRIVIGDTNYVKINALEIMGSEKGLSDES